MKKLEVKELNINLDLNIPIEDYERMINKIDRIRKMDPELAKFSYDWFFTKILIRNGIVPHINENLDLFIQLVTNKKKEAANGKESA